MVKLGGICIGKMSEEKLKKIREVGKALHDAEKGEKVIVELDDDFLLEAVQEKLEKMKKKKEVEEYHKEEAMVGCL